MLADAQGSRSLFLCKGKGLLPASGISCRKVTVRQSVGGMVRCRELCGILQVPRQAWVKQRVRRF